MLLKNIFTTIAIGLSSLSLALPSSDPSINSPSLQVTDLEKREPSPLELVKRQRPNGLWYQAGKYSHYAQQNAIVIFDTGVGTWFQSYDGNLVVYAHDNTSPPTGPLWATGTDNGGGCHTNNCQLVFQADGNLVIYFGTTAVWNTATYAKPGVYPGYTLGFFGTSPYLAIYDNRTRLIWTSG